MKISPKQLRYLERFLWIFAILLVFIIQVNIPSLSESVSAKGKEDSSDKYLKLFMEVMEKIRYGYVDETKVTYKNLIYGAIKGMIGSLEDPHSSFFNEKQNKEFAESMRGTFYGIGVWISKRDDKLIVTSPIEGTPGWEAGLQPGDHIAEIDGLSSWGLSLEEAITKIKGPKGTVVNLTILREGESSPLHIKIKRDEIKVPNVRYAKMKDSDTGYLKIIAFNLQTTAEVKKALTELKAEKIDSLIIDLRYNPGGSLDVVCKIVDFFLEEGKICYTKNRSGDILYDFRAQSAILFPTFMPVVVLVDNYSASASEIFAGAMQDHKRAILIGEKTFGKFSVQNKFPIDREDNTAFKMTIAKYYLPGGRSLHKEGIVPDIVVPSDFYTPVEVKMIKKLNRLKLIENYVKRYPDANEDEKQLDKFLKEIYEEDINLSKHTIENLLHQKRSQKQLMPKYNNPKFDTQLRRAIETLKIQKMLKK